MLTVVLYVEINLLLVNSLDSIFKTMILLSYFFLFIAVVGASSLILSIFTDLSLTLLSLVMIVTGLFSWHAIKNMDENSK